MFEDIIKEIPKRQPKKSEEQKLIEALKDNIKMKQHLIDGLLKEAVAKDDLIDSMKREIQYLRDL